MIKNINGKAIYSPKGKALEYAEYACNHFVGCSNNCAYCFLKKGRGAAILGGNKPTLKKCFKDEGHALEVFKKELKANLPELQKSGLFFTFTSDPFLPETQYLTTAASFLCVRNEVSVKLLTKNIPDIDYFLAPFRQSIGADIAKKYVAFGFTLTGHDELEPFAATNAQRIEAMIRLHKDGFKTFASIEPIIDFESSNRMIAATQGYCDLYKIGLESGRKYDKEETRKFVDHLIYDYWEDDMGVGQITLQPFTLYLKDSLLKVAGYTREYLPRNCVDRDYDMFQLDAN